MRMVVLTAFVCVTLIAFTLSTAVAQDEQASSETWLGTLDVKVVKLRLRLDITTENGKEAAVITSVDQNNAKLPVDTLERTADALKFTIEGVQASFEGKFQDDKSIVGTFTQFGQPMPLTFEPNPDLDSLEPKRPQMPKEPFPYEVKEVTFSNSDAEDVTLAGTLTIPQEGGPFPAVLLVSGSGPQDRDESLMGHKPFWVLADHLTRNGIAVLRYDDRGIGESTGDFSSSTTEDFSSDAAAGLKFLSQQENIERQRIGLIGHSEGGLIAATLAANNDQLAHVVLLAGPGVPGDQVVLSQAKAIIGEGVEDPDAEMRVELFKAIRDGADDEELKAIGEKHIAKFEGQQAEIRKTAIQLALKQVSSPWFRYFLTFDPQPALRQAKCPVLAMIGTKDTQVLVDLNLPAIEEALADSAIENHRFERLEGLNHLFQTAETGLPGEYGEIEETMAPQALDMIADWINSH